VSTRRFVVVAGVLFAALTAVMTFPQALHLADAVRDDGDPLLVTWIFAWVAHQLPLAPAHLFDANIFYPERHTLAFAETLLAPALMVAPLHWVGVNGIFIYNLVLLAGFALSGVATALLVRSLTQHTGAAIVAGIVFAFLPYRIDQFSHLQLQQTQWIPVALWALHALLRTGRLRDGVLLGASFALTTMSSVYYGLFLIPYMVVVGAVLLAAQRDVGRRHLAALTAGAGVAAIALLPAALAYMAARANVGERPFEEVVAYSASWSSYLAAPAVNLVYGGITAPFVQPERVLFPGIIAVALAVIGVLPRNAGPAVARGGGQPVRPGGGAAFAALKRYATQPQFAYALGLVVALDLSLGVNGVIYRLLYAYALPFRALRAPARMGIFVGFSLAVLAGYGVARIGGWFASRQSRVAAIAAIALAVLVEDASRPLALLPIRRGMPPIYADLLSDRGDSPDAAIVEYPMGYLDDPTYMYYSTFHWQRLANGYSGFFPKSYSDLQFAFENFPDNMSIGAIKSRGIRYLLVHGERLLGERYDRLIPLLDQRTDLKLVARRPAVRAGQHGETSLYRVVF
jgi:hypothetical protein